MLLEAPACEGTSLSQSEEPGDGRVKYVIIKDHIYRMVIVERRCTMARSSSFRSKLFIG